jgi:flagellar hook-basal body complex protein FliE
MDPLSLSHLSPLGPLGGSTQPGSGGAAPAPGEPTFGDMLKEALQEVNQAQAQAEGEARNLMTGENADMHSAILAVQKADVSFQMMMAVRSKLIDAYREVMRMPM